MRTLSPHVLLGSELGSFRHHVCGLKKTFQVKLPVYCFTEVKLMNHNELRV